MLRDIDQLVIAKFNNEVLFYELFYLLLPCQDRFVLLFGAGFHGNVRLQLHGKCVFAGLEILQ